MNTQSTKGSRTRRFVAAAAIFCGMAVIAGLLAQEWWLAKIQAPAGRGPEVAAGSAGTEPNSSGIPEPDSEVHDHPDQHHGEDDQAHFDLSGHDEAAKLELSDQAQDNVGLEWIPVKLTAFHRTIAVPAVVVEKTGRSQIDVSAPMTGVVTQVHRLQGEAVMPGTPVFELRLTHEDLVAAQSQYLQTWEERQVIQREIARLEEIAADGTVAGIRLLEQQYELQKLDAAILAQTQALVLHGLTKKQVEQIQSDCQLIQNLTITSPYPVREDTAGSRSSTPLQLSDLYVRQGQHVNAGERLCTLADHRELYIEGRAFEEDIRRLRQVAGQGWNVTAVVREGEERERLIEGLSIVYIDSQIQLESRALRFYVALANELVRDQTDDGGRRYVEWQYKPGQRLQLLVPVERWADCIVLPVNAVVQDGADTFVFQRHGNHVDRVPVRVEYRDQRSAVVATDGALFPGDLVASSGAYQMHLAVEGEDRKGSPTHAGHHH